MLKLMSDFAIKALKALYVSESPTCKLDAAEIHTRIRMGLAFTEAVNDSAKEPAGNAGKWARYVLCGESEDDGSFLASIAGRCSPQTIYSASMVFHGNSAFNRGANLLVDEILPTAETTSVSELRASLTAPLADSETSFPKALTVVENLRFKRVRGVQCRSMDAYMESCALNIATPSLIIFEDKENDYAREIIAHSGFSSREIDCGNCKALIVSGNKWKNKFSS